MKVNNNNFFRCWLLFLALFRNTTKNKYNNDLDNAILSFLWNHYYDVFAATVYVLVSAATVSATNIIEESSSSLSVLRIPIQRLFTTNLSTSDNDDDDNDNIFPLIGLGVGNLPHETIPSMIQTAVNDHHIMLFDTSHASRNERLIRHSIDDAIVRQESLRSKSNDDKPIIIHVITKVWYTYLGYNRTKLSVQESLEELSLSTEQNTSVDIPVHVLIHWPRCRMDIPWMDCDNEENSLSQHMKETGPAPLHDSYLDSWKALEDIYIEQNHKNRSPTQEQQTADAGSDSRKLRSSTSNSRSTKRNNQVNNPVNEKTTSIRVASIGISNFDEDDLVKLVNMARIKPHIIQMNVWSYMFDPVLVNMCHQHAIHIQVYNIMNGIVSQYHKCPRAWSNLQHIGYQFQMEYNHHKRTVQHNQENDIQEPPQIKLILSYLIYNKVSIIPRTSNVEHLYDNSIMGGLYKYIQIWYNMDIDQIKNRMNNTDATTISNNSEMMLFALDDSDTTINEKKELLLRRKNIVASCIRSLLTGIDIQPVEAVFDNMIPEFMLHNENEEDNSNNFSVTDNMKTWYIYWVNSYRDNQKILASPHYGIRPNETFRTESHPGHTFIARTCVDWSDQSCAEIHYDITAEYGEEQIFYLPKFDERVDSILEEL